MTYIPGPLAIDCYMQYTVWGGLCMPTSAMCVCGEEMWAFKRMICFFEELIV